MEELIQLPISLVDVHVGQQLVVADLVAVGPDLGDELLLRRDIQLVTGRVKSHPLEEDVRAHAEVGELL